MPRSWRTVRVFISSTFRDMHAERDHLIKAVFPELRERLEAHRIHLVDIDLRWGVTAEQADNDRVLDLCLDEIKKSRPFFLGILGQRYGWVPKSLPEASVKKHGWLQGMAERSITELEILHGVLNDPKMRMHSMFYFRKDDFLPTVPKEVQDRVYLDGHGEKLKSVKEAIRKHCQNYGAPLRDYPCRWDGAKPNPEDATKGRLTGLEEFGQLVKEDLLAALSREYPELTQEAPAIARPGTEDWLAEEADFHERFIEARLQVYVGRDKVHRQLMDYLQGDSTGPLLLSGGSGTGKSSILGRLWEEWSKDHPEDFVLPHFIGASPSSTDIRLTLKRFCLALKEQFKPTVAVKGEQGEQAVPKEVPDQLEKLPDAFREFLQAVPEGSRAVLLIDAVNQLDAYGGAHDMTWLPDALPPQVKIIVSCIVEPEKEQATLRALRARNTQELKVEPLSNEERFEIVSLVPSVSAKSLDPRQIALLLDNPATTNPLYLTVALEELRGFGSFEKLNERITTFPRTEGEKGLVELFLQVLARLENELGASTVYSALASIGTSRHGLSEKELSEFLNRIQLGKEGPADRSGQMLLALRQLRPYLLRRGPYVDFYHRNLYKAVRERYLFREDVRQGIHHALAEYFNQKGLKSERMLSETAHHMREAGMWDELDKLLTDLRFVEAKCAAGMTFELVGDYNSALRVFPEAREETEKESERQNRLERYTSEIISFAKGEIPSLDVITSVRPWTDQQIDASIVRTKNSRFDRIKAFSQFVSGRSQLLDEFCFIPGYCAQEAYHFAGSGPVAEAAEKSLGSGLHPAILRRGWVRPQYNPHPALMQTRETNAKYISIALTPDGKRAVLGGEQIDSWGSLSGPKLQVWDLQTKRFLWELRSYPEYNMGWCAADLSADGKRAICSAMQATEMGWVSHLAVWEIGVGSLRKVHDLETANWDAVWSVAITPCGRRAISVDKKTISLWNLETKVRLSELKEQGDVSSVALLPNGKEAVVAYKHQVLRRWNLETGACLWAATLQGPCEPRALRITADGNIGAVLGAADIHWWDLRTGNFLRTTALSMDEYTCFSMTADGRMAVSGHSDCKLRLWDIETGTCLRRLEGHTGAVKSVAITADGKRALSSGADETLRIWELETGRCASVAGQAPHVGNVQTDRDSPSLEGHTKGVSAVCITTDGRWAVSGSSNTSLRVWDMETGQAIRTLDWHGGTVGFVAITPDGKKAISSDRDYHNDLQNPVIWDVEAGRRIRSVYPHGNYSTGSFFMTPDGKTLVTSHPGKVHFWDIDTGHCAKTLKGPKEAASIVATSDGSWLVLSHDINETGRMGDVRAAMSIWQTESGRLVRTIETDQGYPGVVERLAVTPDGGKVLSVTNRWLFTGGPYSTLIPTNDHRVLGFWDLASGRQLWSHVGAFFAVRITPDGKRAVSFDSDRTLRLWDLDTGRCLAALRTTFDTGVGSQITTHGAFLMAEGSRLVPFVLRNT